MARASSRTLCTRCLEAFEESDLAAVGGERLCGACRIIADRAASEPERRRVPRLAQESKQTPRPEGWLRAQIYDASLWAIGRTWWLRFPLLAYLAYALVRHVFSAGYDSWFDPINLGVHELGHFVFRPVGDFLEAAGGTVLQLVVPVVGILIFRRQREWFGIAVAFSWLGTSFFDVATYAADAREMKLPLVTPGGGIPTHDWNFMLGELGALHCDGLIAAIFRCLAVVSMGIGLGFGGWLLWRMRSTTNLANRVDTSLPLA